MRSDEFFLLVIGTTMAVAGCDGGGRSRVLAELFQRRGVRGRSGRAMVRKFGLPKSGRCHGLGSPACWTVLNGAVPLNAESCAAMGLWLPLPTETQPSTFSQSCRF